MSEGTPPPPPPENQPPAGGTPPPYSPPPGQPGGGYAAAPPPPPAGPTGPRPAELLDRFLARLIDFVLLVIVLVIINIVVIGAIVTSGGGSSGFGVGGTYGAYSIITSVVTTILYVGYFAFMESSSGATIGKKLMKLHVEAEGGGKPSLEQAVKRNIWLAYPILGVIPFLGFVGSLIALVATIMIAVQINSDPQRRPWTDKFAGTQVVKEG